MPTIIVLLLSSRLPESLALSPPFLLRYMATSDLLIDISELQDGVSSSDAPMTQDGDLPVLDAGFYSMQNITSADVYIPQGRDMFYYEVSILPETISGSTYAIIRLGFYPINIKTGIPIDKTQNSSMGKVAESSIRLPNPKDPSMIYPETRHVLMRCPEWVVVTGDHVGCGIDFDDHTIFFTKNGVLTGAATFTYFGITRVVTLFPAVELNPPSATASVNLGYSPFCWSPPDKGDHSECLTIPGPLFDVYDEFFSAAVLWNIMNDHMDISCGSRELRKMKGLTVTSMSVTARATSLSAPGEPIPYYEIKVLQVHKDGLVAVGYELDSQQSQFPTSLGSYHAVGAIDNSWGYNSDGIVSYGNPMPDQYGPKFQTGDIIGCGIIIHASSPDDMGSIFYTLNGSFLGLFFSDVANTASDAIFPSVSLCHPDDAVRANFGQEPFRYPMGRVMRDSLRETQWPRPPKPPPLPSEVISIILADLAPNESNDNYKTYMTSCALVCRYWWQKCSPYLFKTIELRSKADVDILSALIEKPNSYLAAASITSLKIHERAGEVWAYNVAVSLAHRFPRLRALRQERDGAAYFGRETQIKQHTPPRISGSLPALYSAYRTVTTFVLINHHFRSFAALTQLVSALPVLETLKCEHVTWDQRPDNPRLLRAPRRLSAVEVRFGDANWRMIELFTARWGRLPLDWEPSSKCPELGHGDSLLVHGLVNLKDMRSSLRLKRFDLEHQFAIRFTTSIEKRIWHLTVVIETMDTPEKINQDHLDSRLTSQERRSVSVESKVTTWDFTCSPCTTQDGLVRTCITGLRVNSEIGFRYLRVVRWVYWLEKLFSKAPPLFLESVTIASSESTTPHKAAIETSRLRREAPHLQQTEKLRFVLMQKSVSGGETTELEITEEAEQSAIRRLRET